mgnify:CR=1 FL=1
MGDLLTENRENERVGYVQFPLTQKTFSDFVRKLLGEPQHVQGILTGAFVVDITGVEKIYETIMQRVNQQNRADLVDFISKIYFENDTNITIKGLDGLKLYKNIENLEVVRLELTWTFLIQFEDKEAPEKQTIRVSFNVRHIPQLIRSALSYVGGRMGGGIVYEISYTARTWGVDIENLLRKAIESTFIQKNKVKEMVAKVQSIISLLVPIVIYGIIFILNSFFVKSYLDRTGQNIVTQISNMNLSEQFMFLAKYIVAAPWYQFKQYNALFLILMFVICIVFGIYLDDILDNILEEKCFIFLADSNQMTITQKIKKEYGKQKTRYVLTLLVNIICGVLANFAFQLILKIFGGE